MSSNQTTASPSSNSSKSTHFLEGQGLKTLIEAGTMWLRTNQQTVNALNVFPVPDGDTGTNMLLTMQAALSEVNKSEESNIGKMAHAIAQGALMGARGNSGVILSQLWRGFARALDNLDVMDAGALVHALGEARNTAYKGVVRPVEGTILTVAKDMATAAEHALTETNDLLTILTLIVTAGDESVRRTPELLPILKQAGVVDSGGKGLFFIFEGMLRYLNGETLETAVTIVQPIALMKLERAMETIEPGQDFEWVIDFRPHTELNLEEFYNNLSTIGTSIQVGEGDGMYRMHIHVPRENRDAPLSFIENLGTVLKWTGENLVAQVQGVESKAEAPIEFAPVEPDHIAVIAVSPGKGITKIFASLGVAAVVEGGQSMNPSTEEILNAFANLPTDKIILLPNNKNIILAAQNAAAMSGKKVAVIPSRSVPQGLSAILRLVPDGDLDHIAEDMTEALTDVDTGEITVATRSIQINGVDVHQGEVIALLNGSLIEASDSIEKATIGLLDKAGAENKERITLLYGTDITRADVDKIAATIQTIYPKHEIEIHPGGQPHYQLILSIE